MGFVTWAHRAPLEELDGDITSPKVDGIDRKWFVIDAKDLVLGKLAAAAATVLTGKRKPIYTPFLDTGDHVVVINAAKVHLTGRKEEDKIYHRHTGYPGGIKSTAAGDLRKKNPARIVEDAIRGMLPKTKLGRAMFDEAQGLRRATSIPTRPRSRSPSPSSKEFVRAQRSQAYYATGKRKTSIARVHLRPGTGQIQLNDKHPRRLLRRPRGPEDDRAPALRGDRDDREVRRHGHGSTAAAWPPRRARCATGSPAPCACSTSSCGPKLKKAGFLTRDARIKERKKYGQKGARRRFQFSKR